MVFVSKNQNVFTPHDHFCIIPRRIVDQGGVSIVWLETVTRQLKSSMSGTFWSYTLKK